LEYSSISTRQVEVWWKSFGQFFWSSSVSVKEVNPILSIKSSKNIVLQRRGGVGVDQ